MERSVLPDRFQNEIKGAEQFKMSSKLLSLAYDSTSLELTKFCSRNSLSFYTMNMSVVPFALFIEETNF